MPVAGRLEGICVVSFELCFVILKQLLVHRFSFGRSLLRGPLGARLVLARDASPDDLPDNEDQQPYDCQDAENSLSPLVALGTTPVRRELTAVHFFDDDVHLHMIPQ